MRLHTNVGMIVLACAFLATAPPALAQSADEKAAMDAMVKTAEPGAEHKALETLAGSWTVVTKAWMGPGDPAVSKGKGENTTIFGGRYIKQDYEGEFFGMPFEGTGLIGYDKGHKVYVTTWGDTMSTDVIRMTGSYDAAKKTYTFDGTVANPAIGKDVPTRMAIRITSANEYVMEWFDKMPDGQWVRIMEITYTRA